MKFIGPDGPMLDNKSLVNPAVSDKFSLKIKDDESSSDDQPSEKLFNAHRLFPIPKNPPANNPYIRMMKHYNVAMEQNGRNSIDILISEWKPTRTFTLKHGSWFVGILPWAVTFPTAYRISGMMKKKYPIKKDLRIRPSVTPLGPAVVPFILAIPCAITTTAFMKFLVEQSVFFDEVKCPICVQIRGGCIQCCTGVLVPYVTTVLVGTFTSMVQLKQFKPYSDDPKDREIGRRLLNTFRTMKPYLKESVNMGWQTRSILGFNLAAQLCLNMFYVSSLQSEWFTIENILYEKSTMLNNASSSNNDNN